MEMTLARVAKITGGTASGDASRTIVGVCAPESASPDKLCALWDRRAIARVPGGIAVMTYPDALGDRDGVGVAEPRLALAHLLGHFDERRRRAPGIHPSAVVDASCTIGRDVHIGPCCVVSRGAVIGDRAVLVANVYVGEGSTVGDDTTLEPCAVMMDLTHVGARCIIHGGAVIGGDGFGFVPTGRAQWTKIPQIGTVVIEDDVEIGPNCSVDRAAFGETRIRSGTKIGALTQIAHNCDIGRGCVMSGLSGISGSTKVGDGCIMAGQAGIADHVTVGSGVTIAGRAGITKDVPDGMVVAGFPAREHMKENRYQASLRSVPALLDRVKKLERELASLRAGATDEGPR